MTRPDQPGQASAMPFRLEVDAQKTQLRSVPHPSLKDQVAAQAAQAASAAFDALAELSSTAGDGTLFSYAVATHDPETGAKLKAFVASLREEQEDQS